ncbi:Protein of unknown function [Lactobacillus delbrueckii subsp. lactis]|nr:Protein of unknown function [Lactobacillus delbrueckii subsp. bulgaricus]CDR76561.1 Putative uncharacterized protein [Lactobacillus delbrueckii subsp. lactis]CDR74315.1 Protein of unknown function [Lactobacillus delbrueckii subsp. bulgaricus]CDR79808.1 Protein of unknown function [Lactobacillus delbrueckii subsp. lactis]CDR82904.1 Protein of unknown function [Lactobacillus delbrueckii subsp. lactis]
MKQLKLDDI